MAQMLRTLIRLAFLLAAGAVCHAAEGPANESAGLFVRDETRLFSPESSAALAHDLAATRHDTGVIIRIEADTYVEGQTVRDHATALANTIAGDEPVLVLAFIRGSSQSAAVASAGLWRRGPADAVALLLNDTAQILGAPSPAPEQRMTRAAELAMTRLRALESLRATDHDVFGKGNKKLMLVLLATLLGAALVIGLIRRTRRKRAEGTSGPHFFPEATVGARLGAPFGGGASGQTDSGRVG